MGDLLSLCAYRERRKKEPASHPLSDTVVPICMYDRGKFTLAYRYDHMGKKRAIIYNTTTKVVIAKTIGSSCGDLSALKEWAEAVVHEWQVDHGHIEE